MPGGRIQLKPPMCRLGVEMQIKKNQLWQGTTTPPLVGVGEATDVETGTILPVTGYVVQTGKGVVVLDWSAPELQEVTNEQSTETTPVVGPRNVTIFVVGHAKE